MSLTGPANASNGTQNICAQKTAAKPSSLFITITARAGRFRDPAPKTPVTGSRPRPIPELEQTFSGGTEGFLFLGEVKADETVFRFAQETRAGHTRDADLAHEPFGGLGINLETERRDI